MRQCYVLRVFTRGDEGGNHLGAIVDLTGLDTAMMQSIAAELAFSETVFIDTAGDVPHCRIFTPASELPFAGHPLVGAAWLIHRLSSQSLSRVTCEIGAIDVEPGATAATIGAPGRQPATGLTEDRLDGLGLPGVVSAFSVAMPLPYTVVEMRSAEAVAAYRPVESVLATHPHGKMLTLWAESDEGVRLRFFAPGHGVFEDPATGSAAVALAAVRRRSGAPTGSLLISQGVEVGMPSEIILNWDADRTRVGGEVRHDETRELEI
ncbi:MAG: PhzF family phenazine biosynthesis protein [Acidimicrobiia bacterium]|nr:PhzF family phenazine biosynthesis protein [Acidimicrobiia bacterium]